MDKFRKWFKRNLIDYAEDIARHGADQGYPHITYYNQTTPLFNKYIEEIWEYAVQEAEDLGYKNVAEMLSQFGRSDMLNDWTQFQCLLVWYACEVIARELTDE